jgi:hypothetical protein
VDWSTCPHCARPSRFPNVLLAEDLEERKALDARYQLAHEHAKRRAAHAVLQELELRVKASEAVIARPFEEVARLARSDRQLYATYYQLTQLRIPPGDVWDILRSQADTGVFGDRVKPEIRFAALTLDGEGLTNYGNCSIVLKEEMIAHRASVFHENSVMFMMKNGNIVERGFRAPWEERYRVCVAKLADRVQATTSISDFPRLLLKQGTPETDEFVEVHVYGSLTVRAFGRVVMKPKKRQPMKSQMQALQFDLARANVNLEVRA